MNYPCILEVSNSPDFNNCIKQVCIGKLNNKFMCIRTDENNSEQMFEFFSTTNSIKLILDFYEYGRIEKRTFSQWLKK